MKILFVHDRFGALAGAEANLFHTAVEFKRIGHQLSIAHGPGTGNEEVEWAKVFDDHFELRPGFAVSDFDDVVQRILPDLIYVHNATDTAVYSYLVDLSIPVVRMVHDHKLFCLRGCK